VAAPHFPTGPSRGQDVAPDARALELRQLRCDMLAATALRVDENSYWIAQVPDYD
jgi:hypothetical protein